MRFGSRISAALLPFFLASVIPAPGAAPRTDQALKFVDASGRSVRLEAPPRRIAAVGKGVHILLHALYMFPEARELLVGAEKRGPTPSDFLSAIDPGFDRKTFLGVNPGPEQIATLRPDLVLAKHLTAGKLDEPLERIGIPVIYLDLEIPSRFFEEIALIGRLLGNPSRSGEVVEFYRERLERIRQGTAGLSEGEKKTVLVAMYKRRGGAFAVQVPAVNWIQTVQVRTAGGIPVWVDSAQAAGAWTIVNLEQLAGWDPDRIFVVVPHSLRPADVIETLRSDSRWSSLRAVRAGGPTAFPADLFGWDTPDPRWILGMTWLALELYPDRFPGMELEKEFYSYFEVLYAMGRAEIDRVIRPHLAPGILGGR
jgi:ABC-type Fe3+-hydroxamate transport system substrate-binding protein